MKPTHWLLLAIVCTGSMAHADGKFFFRPDEPSGEEPFQRAVLWHEGGLELLVIQPQLRGEARSFGWVVPVPSVPAVGALPAVPGEALFEDLAFRTPPRVVHLMPLVLGILAIVVVVVAVINARRTKSLRPYLTACVLLVGIGVVGGLFTPTLLLGGPAGEDRADLVEVLSADRLGIYETEVVRSTEPGALIEWLKRHGYAYDALDRETIADYVARGWSFACARIALGETDSADERAGASGGLLPPLAFLFESTTPIYPFALTATYATPVEVVLYAATDAPLAHPALELRYQQPDSRGVDGYWLDYLLGRGGTLARNIDLGESLEEVAWSEPVEAPARDPTAFVLATSLTKLHGVLTKEKVTGDILLEPSSRSGSYGGIVYRW